VAENMNYEIGTTDYHVAGEPFRIVTAGAPALQGSTVLERRSWVGEYADHVRALLINEPRGHADMYGCFVVPPNDAGALLGTVFFHKDGQGYPCNRRSAGQVVLYGRFAGGRSRLGGCPRVCGGVRGVFDGRLVAMRSW